MLILERRGDEVFYDNRKLIINAQASKGPGKEVVKVEGLEGSNGQKWISLARLKEGFNEIETQGREVSSFQKYNLTDDERAQIKAHQDAIDLIIEQAKARYIAKPNFKVDVSKMSANDKQAYIENLEAYLASLKGSKESV